MCCSLYKNYKLKVKLWGVGTRERRNVVFFVTFIFFEGIFFFEEHLPFISIYSALNKPSEYVYFYIPKNILMKKKTLLMLAFKFVKSLHLQCILKNEFFSTATVIACFLYWKGALEIFVFLENIPCGHTISMKLHRKLFLNRT